MLNEEAILNTYYRTERTSTTLKKYCTLCDIHSKKTVTLLTDHDISGTGTAIMEKIAGHWQYSHNISKLIFGRHHAKQLPQPFTTIL